MVRGGVRADVGAVVTGKPITDEMARILVAIEDGRLFLNPAGRWEIQGEKRPERRSRDLLRGRGLIVSIWDNGPKYRLTAKGRAALRAREAAS